MTIRIVKETTAFIVTTALSCGVSQIFGAIKLIFDTGLLLSAYVKKRSIKRAITQIEGSGMIDQIAKKLNIQPSELTKDSTDRYLTAALEKSQAKIDRLFRSLKADLCALIPLVGAHLSWRIATEYQGKSFTPFISRGIQHLFENVPKLASKPFFININKKFQEFIKIPVQTPLKTRFLNARFSRQVGADTTVVIFPAQAGTLKQMADEINRYTYLNFNTLAVTPGGYSGSPGVTPSEASLYQDIEAIKSFLVTNGVKKVAWHGYSMGTGAALHAAAEQNPEGLETVFVVADKPYDSVEGVAANITGPFGKGVIKAGLPKGRRVTLPGGRINITDGLDNIQKAEILKKKTIPLFCLMGTHDFLMSRKGGKKNFAIDILKQRYDQWESFLIQENDGHGRDKEERAELSWRLYTKGLLPPYWTNVAKDFQARGLDISMRDVF